MLTIADKGPRGEGGSSKSCRLLTRVGWGYNVVSQMGFNQPKICEKETIHVNLVLLCKAKTKQNTYVH